MVRISITPDYIREAMQHPVVRAALAKKAREKQARAEQIAASEGVELESEVVEGTRPKGRPYVRVQSRNVGQEWGDSKTVRRRILGRAAES
jgi:hypothetical protein